MLLDPNRSALVLVDFQSRLMPVIHDAERVVDNAVFLARVARELGVPVLGTEQNRRALGPNDLRVSELCDRTLHKVHFSAVADGLLPGEAVPSGRYSVLFSTNCFASLFVAVDSGYGCCRGRCLIEHGDFINQTNGFVEFDGQ